MSWSDLNFPQTTDSGKVSHNKGLNLCILPFLALGHVKNPVKYKPEKMHMPYINFIAHAVLVCGTVHADCAQKFVFIYIWLLRWNDMWPLNSRRAVMFSVFERVISGNATVSPFDYRQIGRPGFILAQKHIRTKQWES